MVIEKEIIINTNIEKAWSVLGHDFENAYKWSSVIKHSEAQNNKSLNGSTCTKRGCDLKGMGEISEELISFSNDNHQLAYEIKAGLPRMVEYAENNWKLTYLGTNKTKLEMIMKGKVQGVIGKIMKPMMKMNFSKMGNGMVRDFKFYLENDKAIFDK